MSNIKQLKNLQKYKSNFYLIKRLFKNYVIPYKFNIFISIILMLLVAISTAFNAYLVKPALDDIFIKKNVKLLIIIPCITIIISIVKAISDYLGTLLMTNTTINIEFDLKKELYNKYIYSDISNLNQSSSGKMISKITMETEAIANVVSIFIRGLFKELISLIALIGVMIYQSVELAIIALVVFPLGIYPIYSLGRKIKHLSFSNQDNLDQSVSQMSDSLQYGKLVKSYNCEAFEVKRMSLIIDKIAKLRKKINKLSLASSPIMEMIGTISIALIIWYGGSKVLEGHTTPGAFFSFFTAMLIAYKPFKSTLRMNSSIQFGLGALERYCKIIDTKPKIIDKIDAIDIKNPQGDIEFKNVYFSYIKNKTVLQNINFKLEPNKVLALVGPSGGGKTTIVNMILRLYDPDSGEVILDKNNIKDISLNSLRKSISVVNQEVMLFNDNIIENIRYGKEDATEEEIIKAAKMAEADEFIQKLPEKYYSQIGQNGIMLSGGQRQRIAIARAILYNSPILLLDEATSSLDPISENLIKKAFKKLTKDKTTIVIAHKLSTIMHADKICVVMEGKIVEEGTHNELIKKGEIYKNLYNKQFEPN